MKLHQQQDTGNLFKQYKNGAVQVGEQWYQGTVIVTPDVIDTQWPVLSLADLTEAHFEYLLSFRPEVVLLGTGERFQLVHPKLTLPLTGIGIGVETMDTGAVCRTFNILSGEGRRVVAAIVP